METIGHILRLPDDVHANIVMAEYFSPMTAATGYLGHPRTSLPIILDTDLQLIGLQLKFSADLARLRDLTRGENGRAQWQELTTDICVFV